jgi:hypothetical protein
MAESEERDTLLHITLSLKLIKSNNRSASQPHTHFTPITDKPRVKVKVKVSEVCFVARRMKAKETQSGGLRRFVARRRFQHVFADRPKSTLQPRDPKWRASAFCCTSHVLRTVRKVLYSPVRP